MMMMMMMMNCFYGMVDRRKAVSLISSQEYCQSEILVIAICDNPRVGFEPAQNLSSCLVDSIYIYTSIKYIYSIFSLAVTSLRLFSQFYLREQWSIGLCCIFLFHFWLSLCKILLIRFLSCPIVINYIVEKKLKLVITITQRLRYSDKLLWKK